MEPGQDRPGRPRAGRSARRIPPRASLSSGGAPSTISTPRPRPGWPIRRTRGALQGGHLLVPWGPDPQATCSGAVHAPHPRRCGFGRPRHPVVGADLDADRVEVDHRVEGYPEADAATFMTAPAHRVGDLGGSSPCSGPRRWWTSEWWRISRAPVPPAYRLMIIESNPPRPPLAHGATGRGVKRAGPHPGGAPSLEGARPASRWSWSWSRPRALAAGRCRRLSPLHGPGARPARPAVRAPTTSSGQSGEQPPGPGHHGPFRSRSARTGRTPAPVSLNRRATSRPSTGLFLSSITLNQRQSFHQGLHRPLNTPPASAKPKGVPPWNPPRRPPRTRPGPARSSTKRYCTPRSEW